MTGKRLVPTFSDARTSLQTTRACGMNPDFWYPIEQSDAVKRGAVVGATFWKQPIAVYRGRDGTLGAVEDRCAHRQIRLSLGHVEHCNLVCCYHGWTYDSQGRVVEMKHDLFDRKMPRVRIRSFPVKERYGLIWIFPGDPDLAESKPLPSVPELDGDENWVSRIWDQIWEAHHSIFIDNVCNMTHAHLHRNNRLFVDGKLEFCETQGDRVRLTYSAAVADSWLGKVLMDRRHNAMDRMDICYDYPHHWIKIGDGIRTRNFLLPIDEGKTRTFTFFLMKSMKLPLIPVTLPRPLGVLGYRIFFRFSLLGSLVEDVWALKAEQEGYEEHFDKPFVEPSPVVRQLEELTIRMWQEHLAHNPEAARPSALGAVAD